MWGGSKNRVLPAAADFMRISTTHNDQFLPFLVQIRPKMAFSEAKNLIIFCENFCNIIEVVEDWKFQIFWTLQKNDVKIELQKLGKTCSDSNSDSNIRVQVLNAGPYIPWALLLVHTEPLYQYKKVVQTRASLSEQCMNSKVCRHKFCTNSESDKGGVSLSLL